MSSPALFPAQLLAAGWQEVPVTIFYLPLPWILPDIDITETRYKSPHSGKVHKLHKALKKEKAWQMREQEQEFALGIG